MDNVLDSLFSMQDDNESIEKSIFSDEVAIPKRCITCKTSVICSILPTFMSLSKIRVYISIDQCPYHQPLKNAEIKRVSKIS